MFYTLQANHKLADLSQPIVMGILNLTPDSFFDGGNYLNTEKALFQAEKMLQQGATILDLGAYSTRPNAAFVGLEEEKQRLLPVLEQLIRYFPEAFFSVDTFRAELAKEALDSGADIINDVSGGNRAIFEVVAKKKAPYVLTHSSQNIENLTQQVDYTDSVLDLIGFFQKKISELRQLGVEDIVIDLGFGFGKNSSQNYELLRRLNEFEVLDLPILVGISRKSMIWRKLGISPQEALNGTTALHALAIEKGAKILRVHDVQEARQVIDLLG